MNEKTKRQENAFEIDLQDLLMTYLRRWVLIVICAVLVCGVSLLYTRFFVTPMYRSSVMLYVNNTKESEQLEYVSNANLVTSQRLVSTYITIIRSDTVLQKVVDAAFLDCTPDAVRSMMSASQVESTEIFEVTISHENAAMAARIANAVAEVAPDEIAAFVDGSSARVIDYAKVAAAPYTPNYVRNGSMGAIGGLVIALVIITLQYLLDVRIKDSADLERLYEYPVLGQIPAFDQEALKDTSGYARGYAQSSRSRTVSASADTGSEK